MGTLIKILREMNNVVVLMDELHVYFDAYSGVSKKTGTWYLKEFLRQTRKRNVKFYFTSQTFMDVHKSIRRLCHKLWLTEKLHPNFSPCYDDFCYNEHIQKITDVMTGTYKYFKVNPNIFKLYDSNEIVEWEN
jgi:hypothetical protein